MSERNAGTARVRRLEARSCGTANNHVSPKCHDTQQWPSQAAYTSHAEIRGIGRRAKLPLTCCNRPPFRMLAPGEEQHQNGVSCTLSMMRFCMRFAVTSPAKCYQAGATAGLTSAGHPMCARIRPGALKFARFIVLAIGQRVLSARGRVAGRARHPRHSSLSRGVLPGQLRRGYFLASFVRHVEPRFASPCALELVAHVETQPP
jgi:hypothetical protein